MVRRLVLLVLLALPVLAQQTQPNAASALANAASRYVRDGAGSPVAWQAWGPAAFERAKREKKPLFVSIGIAASYDVYRMQREAFTIGELAETLNTYTVPVLLDRLEYPEIAEALATVAKSMQVGDAQGNRGWPLNVLLTHNLEPFAAAGALAPDALGRFLVINTNRWTHERAAVDAEAHANVEKARALGEKRAPGDVDAAVLDALAPELAKETTPRAMALSFLLRNADRLKNDAQRDWVVDRLRRIAVSPLYDQFGGGFHRTPDAYEKMLGDQALMAMLYTDAWQLSHDPDLALVARATLDYVVRDLHARGGGFDASQDAGSLIPGQGPELHNGIFYLWTKDEITRLLGRDDAAKLFAAFHMSENAGNRPLLGDPTHLHELRDTLAAPVAKLLDVRQKRPEPFRDFDEIASLNGLMISALARGGAVFNEPRYTNAATEAARAVTSKLWLAPQGKLYRNDAASAPHADALTEDYALLVQGLLDLFDASYDAQWLERAIAIQQRQDALFWDASWGRYTTGSSTPESLRGLHVERDDDVPSANAVSAQNLLRLAALTGNATWRTRPATIFQSFGARLRRDGASLPQLANAYVASLVAPKIVVVTGDARKKPTVDLLQSLAAQWDPMRALVFLPTSGPARDRILRDLPFVGALTAAKDNLPLAYVCANGRCERQ
ncbi:MAG: thioredoxin domain-containing protein [Acidobacteria bacterium]|nr:thioredoxin domain-containing protein [Acidobacteriota bacterium]MBV9476750.1 thioredoxin domain-containing protein [Acidobacteriota bacterium]